MRVITINNNDKDKRLDNFLRKAFPKLSMSGIYQLIRKNKIKINGKKEKYDYRLKLNDIINIYVNDEYLTKTNKVDDFLLAPNNIDIVYEDQNLIIVNKPAGLVVHDDETKTPDTLINRIKHYLYDKKEWDYLKENQFTPSLVHRLDRNTSGLIITAKNNESLKILSEKIKNHEINKYYLCWVHGFLNKKEDTISAYLTRNFKTKMVTITKKPINEQSEQIITGYKVLKHDANNSLLEVNLITGKTHQIRAHFAFIGHPLVGERKYTNENIVKNKNSYQKLVAYKVVFNFKTPSGILEYLKNKSFSLNTKLI